MREEDSEHKTEENKSGKKRVKGRLNFFIKRYKM
jgi:hypothetical protein